MVDEEPALVREPVLLIRRHLVQDVLIGFIAVFAQFPLLVFGIQFLGGEILRGPDRHGPKGLDDGFLVILAFHAQADVSAPFLVVEVAVEIKDDQILPRKALPFVRFPVFLDYPVEDGLLVVREVAFAVIQLGDAFLHERVVDGGCVPFQGGDVADPAFVQRLVVAFAREPLVHDRYGVGDPEFPQGVLQQGDVGLVAGVDGVVYRHLGGGQGVAVHQVALRVPYAGMVVADLGEGAVLGIADEPRAVEDDVIASGVFPHEAYLPLPLEPDSFGQSGDRGSRQGQIRVPDAFVGGQIGVVDPAFRLLVAQSELGYREYLLGVLLAEAKLKVLVYLMAEPVQDGVGPVFDGRGDDEPVPLYLLGDQTSLLIQPPQVSVDDGDAPAFLLAVFGMVAAKVIDAVLASRGLPFAHVFVDPFWPGFVHDSDPLNILKYLCKYSIMKANEKQHKCC